MSPLRAPAAKDRSLATTGGSDIPALAVKSVTLRFGGLVVLDQLAFKVPRNQFCALIGPNGAGKSSLFNCISNVYRATSGTIEIGGVDVSGLATSRVAAKGVGRTFQNLALIDSMTVLENVLLGGHLRHRARGSAFTGILGFPAGRRADRLLRDEAYSWLGRLQLLGKANDPAGDLPFGTRKRVELARAAMAQPLLLLLDEPAAGLTNSEVSDLGNVIRELHQELKLTTVLIEHHMGMVDQIADRSIVLNAGKLIADGPPSEVAVTPAVIDAYLGAA